MESRQQGMWWRRLWPVAALLLLPYHALGLQWSEVMFNPSGNDDGKEFVELVGTRQLEGCTLRDSASSDTLVLLRNGSDIILIIEDGSGIGEGTDATIYGAGKAIGNGLGNTRDNLTISCDGAELLWMSYDAGLLHGYAEGKSMVYDGLWSTGPDGGTPGVVARAPVEPLQMPDGSPQPVCNNTLLLTLGATNGSPGDLVLFTVVSDGYAAWEATAGGELLAAGDTRTMREHGLTLPESGPVKLVATARECDGFQRATRSIAVLPRLHPAPAAAPEPPNASTPAVAIPDVPAAAPAAQTAPVEVPAAGAAIIDKDRDAIPWISSFGIVTLLVSTALFFHVSRREEGPRRRGKVYKD